MFCPFTKDKCRDDCIFKDNKCGLLTIVSYLEDIKKQTKECNSALDIYNHLTNPQN